MSHDERMTLAHEIISQIQATYGDDILAVGIYGSLARGSDGPFSDIEILCVVATAPTRRAVEWCAGPWKAEVNFATIASLEEYAQQIDNRWPLTHGMFAHIQPIFDPADMFARMRSLAFADQPAIVQTVIEEILVGELYEIIGKLRNAQARNQTDPLVALVVELAHMMAMAIGLANHHCYTTGTQVLTEAVALPDRPAGFETLVTRIQTGQLADADALFIITDTLWTGIVAWATTHHWQIVSPQRIPL
jgi:kanamycin nucleotidyltransferase